MVTPRRRLSLRQRIFFSFLAALLPVVIFCVAAIEIFLVPAIADNARQELLNATVMLKSAVQTAADVAVRSHLKTIAEKNSEIIGHLLEQATNGEMSRDQVKKQAREILLSQRIGSSGYIYCLDSHGVAVVHPNPGVENTDNSRFAFVREQVAGKQGYIEYEWQNPGEERARAKALYMVYLPALDWILSVSSYRSEFKQLVDIGDFRNLVLSPRFGIHGYAYVVNQQGDTLIHPVLADFNALHQKEQSAAFLRTIIDTGSGSIEYRWRNPGESKASDKIAVYESIPEYGWIIVSSSYKEEILAPATTARRIAYGATLLLFLAAALASYLLSGRLSRPVAAMIAQLDRNARQLSHAPLPVLADDELGRLAGEFNTFLATINAKNRELQREKDRYLSLFETSPDAVIVLREYTVIDCNPASLALFAGTRETILNKTVLELSPTQQPSGRASVDLAASLIGQAKLGGLVTFEWQHRDLDGRVFDTEVQLKVFGNQAETVLQVAFIRDITERKRAEAALRDSENKYRLLVENAGDAIFIAQSGVIVFSNEKTTRLTGYTDEELRALSFAKLIHEDDREMVVERHVQRLRGLRGIPSTYSFRIVERNGKERMVQLNTVIIDWNGAPATLNFVRDITEQRHLEEVARHAQKMEAIGTLAGGIAHDFNNILMGIQGRAALLALTLGGDDKAREHLVAIEDAVNSAASLTGQLLGFARGGKYQPKPLDLNELLQASIELFGRTKKELEIIVDCYPAPVVSEVDGPQIEQVLLNLCLNAWQAMPGGGTLRLTSTVADLSEEFCRRYQRPAGRYAAIAVADSGIGMDESTQRRIFDPFFTTKEHSRGTGLGLASAYGIIDNHHGIITVTSKLGQGTTFTIYLPLSQQAPAQLFPVDADIQPGAETVLLIDDEEMIRQVGAALLESLGYRVFTASSGELALQCLGEREGEIDLVLLDLIMPGMDGAAVFEAIQRDYPGLPVVLSSGYALDDVAKSVLAKGCRAFIQKPFSLAVLSQQLRAVLDGREDGG